MAQTKSKAVFYCQNCGYESTKWMGQCPGCKEWNTFVEEVVAAASLKNMGKGVTARNSAPTVLADITIQEEARLQTHIVELDRVLGGGIVQGSLTLVGGDPGIGKSTLLLQTCRQIAEDGHKVLYISG
ncbi:MAG: AAA family ATPase, partial [Acetatifactor sp.]|nr:AAA family ATPase [Acetatifactor sp.]